VTQQAFSLFTDLYELTMVQAYLAEGMTEEATFSLAVRALPRRRNFLVACGLDQVLAHLESLKFSDDDINYLKSLGKFSQKLLDWLADFRFTGDVFAMPEGTPVFGNEPILEIVAPLPQAQLVETFVMNQIHLQTLIASKAARVVAAAQGRDVVEFGARRIHGTDAAVKGARAFTIAGVAGAVGAFGILLAFGAKGSPAVVMAIVFAGAPIINACVAMAVHPPAGGLASLNWPFLLGIVMAAGGGCLVTLFRPT